MMHHKFERKFKQQDEETLGQLSTYGSQLQIHPHCLICKNESWPFKYSPFARWQDTRYVCRGQWIVLKRKCSPSCSVFIIFSSATHLQVIAFTILFLQLSTEAGELCTRAPDNSFASQPKSLLPTPSLQPWKSTCWKPCGAG